MAHVSIWLPIIRVSTDACAFYSPIPLPHYELLSYTRMHIRRSNHIRLSYILGYQLSPPQIRQLE